MFERFSNTKTSGDKAEQQVLAFLNRFGLTLIEQNYRCKQGEIDLIMQDAESVVFIEVRLRNNPNFGSGADSVTAKKQHKIISSAQRFLQKHPRLALKPLQI